MPFYSLYSQGQTSAVIWEKQYNMQYFLSAAPAEAGIQRISIIKILSLFQMLVYYLEWIERFVNGMLRRY